MSAEEEAFEKLVQEQTERIGKIWEIKQDGEEIKIVVKKEGMEKEKSLKSAVLLYLFDIERDEETLEEEQERSDLSSQKEGELRRAIQFHRARLEALNRRLLNEVGEGYAEILGLKSYIQEKMPPGTIVKVRRTSGAVEDGWTVVAIYDDRDRNAPVIKELGYGIEVEKEGKIKRIRRSEEKDFADFRELNNI